MILFIAAGSYAVIFYRQAKADKIRVPSSTSSVVKLDVDRMFWEISRNIVFNYSSYFKQSDRQDSPVSLKLWETGIQIPSTCYFYALGDSRQYYSHFKIRDRALLNDFLVAGLGLQRDSSAVLETYIGPNLRAVLNDDEIVIGVGGKNVNDDFKHIVEGDRASWLSITEIGFALDLAKNSDLAYLDRKGNWLGVDFKPGEAILAGRMKSSYLNLPSQSRGSEGANSDILYMHLNTDLKRFLPKLQQRIGNLGLPLDRLDSYLGNYIEIRLGGNQVVQTDTIISYDYDENFDMIESETRQETIVPELNVRMKASPHLLAHLPEKMFYKFHKGSQNGLVELSTSTDRQSFHQLDSSDVAFSLAYHKPDSVLKLPVSLPNYLKNMSSVQAKGTRVASSEMKISGLLKLENKRLHAFYQVLSYR